MAWTYWNSFPTPIRMRWTSSALPSPPSSARALIDLGRLDEARTTISHGVGVARRHGLNFDLSRLLLLADRIGPPFDPELETTEPAEEAHHLLHRLGVVSTVSL